MCSRPPAFEHVSGPRSLCCEWPSMVSIRHLFYPLMSALMDTRAVFLLCLLYIRAQVFMWTYIFISLGCISGSGTAGPPGNCLTFEELPTAVPGCCSVTFPSAARERPRVSAFSPERVICLCDRGQPSGEEVGSHSGSDWLQTTEGLVGWPRRCRWVGRSPEARGCSVPGDAPFCPREVATH